MPQPVARFAIQTPLLPGDSLIAQFQAAKRYGFDAVEFFLPPEFDLAMRLDDVQAAIDASGLPVCALCTNASHDPLVPDPAERAVRLQRLAELLRLADELGAGGIVSVPVRPPHSFPADVSLSELAVRELQQWSAALAAGTAALFLEPLNRYEAYFLNRVGQAVELCRYIDHPRVMALGDLFHMNIEEADLGQPLRDAGPFLGHVHIADNNRFEPGAGCLNFQTPFAALKTVGYGGYLSIECWSRQGARLSADPDQALPATVDFLRAAWDAA